MSTGLFYNPDLAIEVDITRSKIDRPSIYAGLGVAEVWRFDAEQDRVVIERLRDDATYQPVPASGFLPVRTKVHQLGFNRIIPSVGVNGRGRFTMGLRRL